MNTTDRKNQSFHRRLRFALHGLAHGLRAEHSLRFQAATFAVVIMVLLVLRPGPIWWALVWLSSAAVMAAELLNTAIEHLADHLHPDRHPQIRIVKDCAAAGVLVAVLGAAGVGIALAVRLLEQ